MYKREGHSTYRWNPEMGHWEYEHQYGFSPQWAYSNTLAGFSEQQGADWLTNNGWVKSGT
jgi:hypothetical protein